jgi:hypothetical protein
LRKQNLRYEDIEAETVALLRQVRTILECEHGERLTDSGFLRTLARMVIDGAASPERTRSPYQIAVTICEQCKRAWQHGGGTTVEMSPSALAVAQCDALHIGSVGGEESEVAGPALSAADAVTAERIGTKAKSHDDAGARGGRTNADGAQVAESGPTNAGGTATQPARAKSDIPPALRRKVKHRDHDKCRVPWCRSSRNVDCHHMTPIAKGGKHTFENLISLCESHHLAHHAGALIVEGTASNPTFRRRAHNSFATAERAVDTTRALKTLGFDKSEVKAAMEKTRTHVGTAELTLEQWIKIALGYCPKPRG